MNERNQFLVCATIVCLSITGKIFAQVGIGTSSPTTGTKFEIVGSGNTSATTALRVLNSSSSTPLLLVRDDGKVSIGSSNNVHMLDVSGNTRIGNYLHSNYNNEILAGVDATGYFFAAGSGLNSSNIPIYLGNRASSIIFTTSTSTSEGTEKMRITSEGTLLLGKTTQAAYSGGSGIPRLEIVAPSISSADADGGTLSIYGNSAATQNTGAALVLGQAYNGTTTATGARVRSGKENTTAGDYSSFIAFDTRSNGIGLAERMRIESDGDVLIGTMAQINAGKVYIEYTPGLRQGIAFRPTRDDLTPTPIAFFNTGGAVVGTIITSTTTTTYNTSSDYRLKENIQPIAGALERINKLKPVTYNWKTDGTAGEGFIAHELQEVAPLAVSGIKDAIDKDGKPIYQGIDPGKIVGLLTAGIQELEVEIEELKKQIEKLKARPTKKRNLQN